MPFIAKHPMQTVILDQEGVPRFQSNPIVEHLLDVARKHGCDLNDLAQMSKDKGFEQADWQQFAQLIGYSTNGYGELGYVPLQHAREVDQLGDDLLEKKKSEKGRLGLRSFWKK